MEGEPETDTLHQFRSEGTDELSPVVIHGGSSCGSQFGPYTGFNRCFRVVTCLCTLSL